MKPISNFLFAVGLPLLLAGCSRSPQTLAGNDLIRFVEDTDHGLKKEVKAGDWTYELQYKPVDYVIAVEGRGNVNEAVYRDRRKELDQTLSFNVSFKNEQEKTEPLRIGIKDMDEYNHRLSYYLNEANHDFALIADGDTLYTAGYVFEPNYNLLQEQKMVVSFSLRKHEQTTGNEHPRNMQLVFKDRVFNNGIIKATWSEDDLSAIPTLKFN